MDFPILSRTPVESIARDYLLAQAVYKPTVEQLSETISRIKQLNADKLDGECTRASPAVIHVPGGITPPRETSSPPHGRWVLTGMPSQYGLGRLLSTSVDNGVATHVYERGTIAVYRSLVLEVTVGETTIPGDVVAEAQRFGNFIRIDPQPDGAFYRYRRGYVQSREPDGQPVPYELTQRRDWPKWTRRTLIKNRGTHETVFVYRFPAYDVRCAIGDDGSPVCRASNRQGVAR